MAQGEHGFSADAEHRRAFPGRRCVVANAECEGNVVPYGPTLLCVRHAWKWGEADAASLVDRMREWVRAERARGARPPVNPTAKEENGG